MLASLTPSQRVRMMSGMFDTACRLLVSNIRATHSDISDIELRVQTFLRTCPDDFTPSKRDRNPVHPQM
jgi:hypothetical protein